MGMTPTIESKAKYGEIQKILDSQARSQKNNPGLLNGGQQDDIQKNTGYKNNMKQFYQDSQDPNTMDDNQKKFYMGMTPTMESQALYEQQRQRLARSPLNRNLQIPNDQDFNKNSKEFYGLDKSQQPIQYQPQSSQINHNLQAPYNSQQSQNQQPQSRPKVQKPFHSEEKPQKILVIGDSDSVIREQIHKFLFNKAVHEYEFLASIGGSQGLMTQNNYSQRNLEQLFQNIGMLERIYDFRQVMFFDSCQSKNNIIFMGEVQRTEVRNQLYNSLNLFKNSFVQKFQNNKQFIGYIFDNRGNPEKIF